MGYIGHSFESYLMWYSQTERKTVRHKSRLSDTIMDPLVSRYPGGFPIKPRGSLNPVFSSMVLYGHAGSTFAPIWPTLLQYGPPWSCMDLSDPQWSSIVP